MRRYEFGDGLEGWQVDAPGSQVVQSERGAVLRLEAGAVWLREGAVGENLVLRTRVRSLDGVAYAGIAFRGADSANYELVYVCLPERPETIPQALQYDPTMRGVNTWQLFHTPPYVASAMTAPRTWYDLEARVVGSSLTVALDGSTLLSVPRLQHHLHGSRLGLWAYLPSLFESFEVADLPADLPINPARARSAAFQWEVAPAAAELTEPAGEWRRVSEDETGLLNISRVLDFRLGAAALVRACWESPEAYLGTLSLGYSDECVALWNGEAVHSGSWLWAPPEADGRVRLEPRATVAVRRGLNTLLARVRVTEPFGWGIGATLSGPAAQVDPRGG